MSILNFVGFETQDLSEIASSAAASAVANPDGYGYVVQVVPVTVGTGYVRMGVIGADGQNVAGTTSFGTDVFYLFRIRIIVAPTTAEQVCALRTTGGADKLSLVWRPADSKLDVRNTAGTVVGTTSTAFSPNTWYRIELRCQDSATVGNWEIKINGTSEASGTSNTSATGCGFLVCGKFTNLNGGGYTIQYDDLAADGAGYVGDKSARVLIPTSNGTDVAWNSGSTQWQNINEIPPDSTAFIDSTLVLNARQGANVTDCGSATPAITAGITSVKAVVSIARSVSQVGSVLSPGVRSSAAFSENTTAFAPATAATILSRIVNTDPNTGAAWTTTGLDAAQVVVKNNSTTRASRWHTGYLMALANPAPFSRTLSVPVIANATNTIAPNVVPGARTLSVPVIVKAAGTITPIVIAAGVLINVPVVSKPATVVAPSIVQGIGAMSGTVATIF